MADRQLSDKEAALIAQARAELLKKPAAAAPAGAVSGAVPAAATHGGSAQPQARALAPEPAQTAAERVAAVMAAAHAETERRRHRHKMLYVWGPIAFITVTGMSTLMWMLFKL